MEDSHLAINPIAPPPESAMNRRGFVWGVATAPTRSRAPRDDGRRPSIWDTFCATPGTVHGDTGDVACDHYHRWAADLDLIASARASTPTASRSPGRACMPPDGAAPTPGARLLRAPGRRAARARACSRCVDALPLGPAAALEDRGGWLNRDTAYRFADYAASSAARCGDRVAAWSTLNEPWCSAFLGYHGRHAPGRAAPAHARPALHHLLLGHGLARPGAARQRPAAGRHRRQRRAAVQPADRPAPPTAAAARPVRRAAQPLVLDPLLEGSYPDELFACGQAPSRSCRTATWPRSASRSTSWASTTTTASIVRSAGAHGFAEVSPPGRRAHHDGLGGRARTVCATCCTAVATRYAGPAADLRHRERHGLGDEVADGAASSDTGAHRLPAAPLRRRARRHRRPASTCAATSSGRCWTTSSGPTATSAASAWSTSTTPPRSAR